MIHFRRETLFASRVMRRRPRAANIAGDDAAVIVEQVNGPTHVFDRKTPTFPVGHRFFRPQAIEIDRHVDLRVADPPNELLELIPPVAAVHNTSIPVNHITRRSILNCSVL